MRKGSIWFLSQIHLLCYSFLLSPLVSLISVYGVLGLYVQRVNNDTIILFTKNFRDCYTSCAPIKKWESILILKWDWLLQAVWLTVFCLDSTEEVCCCVLLSGVLSILVPHTSVLTTCLFVCFHFGTPILLLIDGNSYSCIWQHTLSCSPFGVTHCDVLMPKYSLIRAQYKQATSVMPALEGRHLTSDLKWAVSKYVNLFRKNVGS